MTQRRRRTAPLLVLAAALLLTAGCSSRAPMGATAAGGPVTVTLWHAYPSANTKVLADLVARFNAGHPGIRVEQVNQGNYDSLFQKLSAAVAAHQPPTISQAYENQVAKLLAAGAVAELDPFVQGPDGLKAAEVADFLPTVWDSGMLQGKRYMIPFSKSDLVLFYNHDRFREVRAEAPRTWDELWQAAQRLTGPERWGMDLTPEASHFFTIVSAYGGEMFSGTPPHAAFNSPAAAEAMAAIRERVQSGAVHFVTGSDALADFAAGKAAMFLGSSAGRSYVGEAVGKRFKLEVMALPAGPAGAVTDLYGAPFVIFKQASPEQQKAAWIFARWLLEPEQVADWSLRTGYLPVRRSALAAPALQGYYAEHPDQMAAVQQLSGARCEPPLPAWNGTRLAIARAMTAMFSSNVPVQLALDAAAREADQILAEGG